MSEKKYFVVSLPRSGTTSVCKMAKLCGLKPKHAPHFSFLRSTRRDEFNFFADTPVFSPDQIEIICNDKELNSNFIYIDRNFEDFFNSWVNSKLYRNYLGLINATAEELRPSQKFDLDVYNKTFNNEILTENNMVEVFKKHKENVMNILKKYEKNVLIYNFKEGWKPFCDFINAEIPQEDIPVLNKEKMFDKYE